MTLPVSLTRTNCVPMIEAMMEMPPSTSGIAIPALDQPACWASSMPATSVTA